MRAIAIVTGAFWLAACDTDRQENAAQTQANSVATPNEVSPDDAEADAATADELQPVDNSARPTPPNGGAASGDMAWTFSRGAAGPRMAYGVPQTDNVRLMLRCPETGLALLSFILPPGMAENLPDTLSIISGSARRSLTIETQQGPLGTSVEAHAPLSAAPLQQFRSGNEMEVRWGDEIIELPAAPEGPVRQFFEGCS